MNANFSALADSPARNVVAANTNTRPSPRAIMATRRQRWLDAANAHLANGAPKPAVLAAWATIEEAFGGDGGVWGYSARRSLFAFENWTA